MMTTAEVARTLDVSKDEVLRVVKDTGLHVILQKRKGTYLFTDDHVEAVAKTLIATGRTYSWAALFVARRMQEQKDASAAG